MRLLMLEFDLRLNAAVARTLKQHGVTVEGSQSFDVALSLASEKAFDAYLLDCDSLEPGELLAFAWAPRILTTSFIGHESGHRFFGHGVLLPKPYTGPQLIMALKEGLGVLQAEPKLLVDQLRQAHTDAASVGFCVGHAEIVIEHGELIHAEWGHLRGEEALSELLSEARTQMFKVPVRTVERTIHRPFHTLLLDLLQQIDERESGVETGQRKTLRPTSSRPPKGIYP